MLGSNSERKEMHFLEFSGFDSLLFGHEPFFTPGSPAEITIHHEAVIGHYLQNNNILKT
jgi:hypothetical protein